MRISYQNIASAIWVTQFGNDEISGGIELQSKDCRAAGVYTVQMLTLFSRTKSEYPGKGNFSAKRV